MKTHTEYQIWFDDGEVVGPLGTRALDAYVRQYGDSVARIERREITGWYLHTAHTPAEVSA